ncbi:acyl-CoA dehydrogenase family protein [Nocardia sp. NPDC052566]|uniref:acyl-CoA dehydrogenase family protein n=1 Tax=Nocardia sp. NPDC052566 TaxID=3364330 RepID=UPI0037C5D588
MTIFAPALSPRLDQPQPNAETGTSAAPSVAALRGVIFGEVHHQHRLVSDAVTALGDVPIDGLTHTADAARGPQLLRAAIAGLGGSAGVLAADPRLRGMFIGNAAVAAPRLLRVSSGHFDLALAGMMRLGNGSAYQAGLLALLETGTALGVLAHTELGGTNGPDVQTTAEWDAREQCWRLSTPGIYAAKFMPNVAMAGVGAQRVTVVTARALVQGRDEGVFAFVMALRSEHGLAEGVEVVPLPEKGWAAMDHAMIAFDHVRLPRDALLAGEWARVSEDNQFVCALSRRQRFHRTIAALAGGRIDLANATVATARTAVAMLVNYSATRRPVGGIRMADRDAVQQDLATAVSAVYAMSALGAVIVEQMAADTDPDQPSGVWALVGKPLLSTTAHRVLHVCRQRGGAQAALRVNYVVDWLGNAEGVLTAEGETQVLQVAAGRLPRQVALGRAPDTMDISTLQVPGAPADRCWWDQLLVQREQALAGDARDGIIDGAAVLGPDSHAIEVATATAQRLAVDALRAAAARLTNPLAHDLITTIADLYACERIWEHAGWYTAHGSWTGQHAAEVAHQLSRLRRVIAAELPLLVSAFDVPPLPAPMLSRNYLDWWRTYAGWDDRFPAAADAVATPR